MQNVRLIASPHSPSGNGGIGSTIVGLDLTLDTFVDITRNGAGAMHGFVQILSDEQIETLGAYLLNLGQVGSVRTSLAGIDDPAEMYSVACAVCHGVGAKGAIGSDLAGTSMSIQEMIAVIADGAPSMPAYSAMMDARQIGALAEFIAGLEGAAPSAETSIVVASPFPVPSEADGGSSTGLWLLVLALFVAGGLGGLAFWRYKTQQGYR